MRVNGSLYYDILYTPVVFVLLQEFMSIEELQTASVGNILRSGAETHSRVIATHVPISAKDV